jgi:hypothetical protein
VKLVRLSNIIPSFYEQCSDYLIFNPEYIDVILLEERDLALLFQHNKCCSQLWKKFTHNLDIGGIDSYHSGNIVPGSQSHAINIGYPLTRISFCGYFASLKMIFMVTLS